MIRIKDKGKLESGGKHVIDGENEGARKEVRCRLMLE
jgi:hypothetical protein